MIFFLQMLEGGGHLPYAELTLGDYELFLEMLDREALLISLGELDEHLSSWQDYPSFHSTKPNSHPASQITRLCLLIPLADWLGEWKTILGKIR